MTRGVFFKALGCLVLTCLVAGLAGCAKKEARTAGQAGSASAGADKGASRTIVDHTGVETVLPAEVNRVVILGPMPLPSIYCLYAGSSEQLVGITSTSMSAAQNSLLIKAYPELTAIPTDFEINGVVNIERLLELEPDVVFYAASSTQTRQALDNAGIPAVGFSFTQAGFNTIENYAGWIELLEQIFSGGNEAGSARAAEIIQYGRDVESMIKERLAGLAQEDKPKALVAYYYDEAGGLQVSGANHFGQYWLDTAGGINVASELDGTPTVNMEQVYQWNPDAIFITNFSPYLPEDFYNNVISSDDWSPVEAVQSGRVYKFPLGMYRWYPPSSDTPLSLMWMAKTLHPDLFADIDLDQMVKDYFQRFYGVELTEEELHRIYNPPREAAGR